MLYQLISIYTSDFFITMLLGVLVFMCLPVFAGEISETFPISTVVRIIPVVSNSVFAGEQIGSTELKDCMIPLIMSHKYLIRHFSYRLD